MPCTVFKLSSGHKKGRTDRLTDEQTDGRTCRLLHVYATHWGHKMSHKNEKKRKINVIYALRAFDLAHFTAYQCQRLFPGPPWFLQVFLWTSLVCQVGGHASCTCLLTWLYIVHFNKEIGPIQTAIIIKATNSVCLNVSSCLLNNNV